MKKNFKNKMEINVITKSFYLLKLFLLIFNNPFYYFNAAKIITEQLNEYIDDQLSLKNKDNKGLFLIEKILIRIKIKKLIIEKIIKIIKKLRKVKKINFALNKIKFY